MANPMMDYLKNGKSKKKKKNVKSDESESKADKKYESGLDAKELVKYEKKETGD